MRWLLQWSFGCRHANTSFPLTVASGRGGSRSLVGAQGAKVTYVTCLSCGQEFNYCWRTMQRLPSAPAWIEEPRIEKPMSGYCSSRQQREIEELRRLWMT
jgi:hypothetical protein